MEASDGISCEVLDLQTLLPWDVAAVEASVNKTGRHVQSSAVQGSAEQRGAGQDAA